MTARTRNAERNVAWQGMNWIRPVKRLAIYLRDGLACAWCGAGIETGVTFTLDHLKPHNKGGSNEASNLVTCCKHCNDSRGKRGQIVFARAVATYVNHGVTAQQILAHVRRTSARSLKPFLAEAKQLIEQRGGFSFALQTLKGER